MHVSLAGSSGSDMRKPCGQSAAATRSHAVGMLGRTDQLTAQRRRDEEPTEIFGLADRSAEQGLSIETYR